MITVNDRVLQIPSAEAAIGFVGDNKVETRKFEITEVSLFNFDFKLDLKIGSNIGIVDLYKDVYTDKIILTWTILQEHLPGQGTLFAQLRAFSKSEEIWHSQQAQFDINDSINATESFPSPLPNEFAQMEQRVTAAKNETLAAAEQVSEDKETVAADKQTVLTKANEAAGSAADALLYKQAAKGYSDNADEKATQAGESEAVAAQALADLLAMLGSDVATLTNGKLTPSQIPAIAVTDTFVVSSEAAMLALTAETGDVCIRTDESKSYILQGNDPSVLTDWQQLKTPTNYADEAGYAATAGMSEDSQKINGHRVVYMTQAQYDVAVKDPDTVYMVGVE